MTFLRDEVCEGCNCPIRIYEIEIIGGPNKGEKQEMSIPTNEDGIVYGCECEDIELAKDALRKHEINSMKRVKSHFDSHSLISKRLKQATIESYDPSNKSQSIAKKSVVRFIEIFDLDDPINILFTGGFGVGKSHLAKAITDGVMEAENPSNGRKYTSIFISVPKLLRKIRSTYNNDSDISEGDIFQVLEQVDLLVLDDLGAERQNDWTHERLFDIIDSRQGMHTIYTSNYDEEDLFKVLGERNFSRIVNEDTKIIHVEGTNYRIRDMNLL